MMYAKACIALLCLSLLHSCTAFSWKPCTDVESKSSIKDVDLTPDPPCASLSLIATGLVLRDLLLWSLAFPPCHYLSW